MQAHQRHKEGENVDSEGSDNPNPLEHTPDLSCTDCHPITRNLSEDLDNYLDTFQEQVQSVSYYTQVSFNEFQQTIDPVIINNSIAQLYRSIRFIESPSFIKFRRHFLDYFAPTPDSETSSINLDLTTTEEGYHHDLSVLLEREEQSTEDSPRFTSVEETYPLPDFEEEENINSEGSDNPNLLEHTPDLSCTDCHPVTRNLSEDLDNYLDTLQEQVQCLLLHPGLIR